MKENVTAYGKKYFVNAFIIISLFAVGLFNEFLSCFAAVILCVYLAYFVIKNKEIKFNVNLTSISVTLIVISYAVTAFWAVDKGSAIIGFFKFLPLLLFLIVVMQQSENFEHYLKLVPYAAAVMTVVSSVLMQVPSLEKWFSVSGRLSGFFQYSNTFSLLLLIALIIVVTNNKYKIYDYITIPILIFGILYSGSRTVFVLTIVSALAVVLFGKNKKISISLVVSLVLIILCALIYGAVTDNFDTFARFLTMSFKSSTFVGRFLYFKDSLPVILSHPFGTGYMGFYYLQQSIQTGVYSVKYLHNDFLQLMIDIGWIPTAVFIAAIAKSFFSKESSFKKRLLIFIISAHCCFDFDLQFIAIFMIFILLLDYKSGKELSSYYSSSVIVLTSVTACVLAVLSMYMGVSQTLSYLNQNELSSKLYPWNTQNDIKSLSETNDPEELDNIANRIISRNEYVAVAYSAKALSAYSRGDIESVIKYKNEVFEKAPFSYEEYEEYCYMMIYAANMYKTAGDTKSAKICEDELISTVEKLQSLPDRLSSLGKIIDDQPKTDLPQEILDYTEEIKK